MVLRTRTRTGHIDPQDGSVVATIRARGWHLATVGLMLFGFILLLGQADSAGAQSVVDQTSCGHYETQADAQAALDSGTVPNPEHLDPDGDGVACEDAFGLDPDGPPPARDYASCGHFASQAAAQQVLDSGTLPNPEALDWDGDGIACEDVFGTEGVTSLPKTGGGGPAPADSPAQTLLLAGIVLAVTGTFLARRRHAMR